MIISGTKRFLLTIVALLVAGMLTTSSFGADVSEKGTATEQSPQKTDPQADKQRLIESRKEQQQKRGELRDAVKSGASKDEIKQMQKGVKEGQKAIVQDKKQIRKDQLQSTKDQKAAKQGTQASKDVTSKDATSKDTK